MERVLSKIGVKVICGEHIMRKLSAPFFLLAVSSLPIAFAQLVNSEDHEALSSAPLSEILDLIEEMDPSEFDMPTSETLFFPISNGGFGEMAKANTAGARDPGTFVLDAASGAALIQDYIPGQGPDCEEDAEEPLVIYYGFYADEDKSLLAINESRRLGAVIATGTAVKYRPGPTFCEDEAYISEPASPAFLHMPMSTFGQSPRNFQAMGVTGNEKDIRGMFATRGFSARLGGYADARMLGQSTAMSEMGMAGAIGQAALAGALANNPEAAAALEQMPGMLPGQNGEGALQMDLATAPVSQIAGSNVPFAYAQVRFVHTNEHVTPGSWLEDLQQAIRIEGPILESEPAVPNSGALEE